MLIESEKWEPISKIGPSEGIREAKRKGYTEADYWETRRDYMRYSLPDEPEVTRGAYNRANASRIKFEDILKLKSEGKTQREIADAFGCSQAYIFKRLKRGR